MHPTRRPVKHLITLAVTSLTLLDACSRYDDQKKTSEQKTDTISRATTPPTNTQVDSARKADTLLRKTDTIAPKPFPETSDPATKGAWTISFDGFGALKTGMTIAEANKAVGGGFKLDKNASPDCDYVRLSKTLGHALVMVVQGHVARVDVRDTLVATDRGARVGDSEARIDSLYLGLVTIEPHHYTSSTGGHYLVITPKSASDTLHRLIFETDGKRVTQFRSGVLPAVRYVEGCA